MRLHKLLSSFLVVVILCLVAGCGSSSSDTLNSVEPTAEESGNQKPDGQNPDSQDPSGKNPGNQDSDSQDPGSQNPGSQNPGNQNPGNQDPSEQLGRYALANRCFALKSVKLDRFVVRSGAGQYAATADSLSDASGFFMKPANLGRYMFYADNQTLVSLAGTSITRFRLEPVDAPRLETGWNVDKGVIWTIDTTDKGYFTIRSPYRSDHGVHAMAVNPETGKLTVTAAGTAKAQLFKFVPTSGCAQFPEIETQTSGHTFEGNGVNTPVFGFADVHNHVSAKNFLGEAHVGQPYSRYGVTVALPDGKKIHGFKGRFDLVGNLYGGTPVAAHDTQGWPTFNDWPAHDSLLHEGTYYRWIKRTWKSGLRLLVNNVVQNQVLCVLYSLLKAPNPASLRLKDVRDALNGLLGQRCNGMETAVNQIHFMYRMQDYIDAQSGGPGEGWFRIVTSPKEARKVINQGKLAVVLGIEISHVFNCRLTQAVVIGGSSVIGHPGCTRAEIDAQLQRLYDLGVRQINLTHEFNNALGGNGIFNGFFLNIGNFLDTGSFWQTHDCPPGDYYYSPGSILTSLDPLSYLGENPLSAILGGLLQGTLPVYPAKVSQCNDRGLTELGRYAVEQVMNHHMIIDVDHMSLKMKGEVIDTAQKHNYPLISSHGGHGGISMQQARDIMQLGGLIYPIGITAESWVSRLQLLKKVTPDSQMLAMGFGADTNGLAAQPGPRAKDTTPVQYPFTLFQGPDWTWIPDQVAPVSFKRSAVSVGDRYFDINKEGVAQYGLYADWVETVRIAGGAKALKALYHSAERYLRMWERALKAD